MKREAFVPQENGRGLAPVWCLNRIQEYNLPEIWKVVIPVNQLVDLVKFNVVCPLYHNAFMKLDW